MNYAQIVSKSAELDVHTDYRMHPRKGGGEYLVLKLKVLRGLKNPALDQLIRWVEASAVHPIKYTHNVMRATCSITLDRLETERSEQVGQATS